MFQRIQKAFLQRFFICTQGCCVHVFVCLCAYTTQVLNSGIILILRFIHWLLCLSLILSMSYFSLVHPLYFLGKWSSNPWVAKEQCTVVLAPAGNFPQDHTSLMEITSKSNEFLRANIKAAKQFSEYSWTADSVRGVQIAFVGRI